METENLISIQTICRHYEVKSAFLNSLYEYELLDIVTVNEEQFIQKDQLAGMERLMRLHYDLEINFAGMDVISHLLKRIEELERELKQQRNSLPSDHEGHFSDFE